MFGHVLIPLDASPRDEVVLAAAASPAALRGGRLTLLLVRTHAVLQRLRPFAEAEELTLPEAAEAYVARAAERLSDVAAEPVTVPGDDLAAGVARYAVRHGVTLVLVPVEEGRRAQLLGAGRRARLAARSRVPVLAVPAGATRSDVLAA